MLSKDLSLKNNKFLPYISRIVFPQFKNLAKASEINFESAITILTGANGSGKSSILHALFGCPKGYNIGKFWFSTKFDDINKNDCFFYEYNDENRQVHQVLIKRSPRPDGPKYKHKGNTNYWETSRPLIGLGMQGSKDRPPQISKEVQYIDFRANLTAFDKFMYFKNFTNSKGFSELRRQADYKKQNKLIDRSNLLKEEIETGIGRLKRKEKQGIQEKLSLSKDQCEIISRILNKDYDSIDIYWHKYFSYQDPFDDYSPTIILKERHHYSDAYAGSGESSVILLIYKLTNTPDKSLVLLDEPETSIHPEAQKKLMNELQKITVSKSLQVIICTHSEYIISNFDRSAIRTFYKESDGTYSIIPCSAELALSQIGVDDKFNIYLEDKLSKEIMRRLYSLYDVLPNLIDCGGVANMLAHYVLNIFFVETCQEADRKTKHIFILDGDQKTYKKGEEEINRENLLKQKLDDIKPSDLENIIENILSSQKFLDRFKVFGTEKKIEKMRELFQFLQEAIKFFPANDPESFIINNLNKSNISDKDELKIIESDQFSNKIKFEEIAKQKLQKNNVDSAEIFFVQKEYLAKINKQKLKQFFDYLVTTPAD